MPRRRGTTTPAPPLSLRLSAELLAKVDEVQALYITNMNPRGFSAGPVKGVTRAEIVRWALEEGLTLIKARLSKKGGRS